MIEKGNEAKQALVENQNIENYKEIKPDKIVGVSEGHNLFDKIFNLETINDIFESLKSADSKESNDASEYDEEGTRELTLDEKQMLKDKLGWSDEKIERNCRIDKDGVIHYKTNNQALEGKTAECGVKYERKRFEYNGVIIEGVFPKFDSVFTTQLPEEKYKTKAYADECNSELKEAIENDPELKGKFTKEQLQDIENGDTPRGYTWHHNEEPGKMELVKIPEHTAREGGAAHTGGNSLWGYKSVETIKAENKGVNFNE